MGDRLVNELKTDATEALRDSQKNTEVYTNFLLNSAVEAALVIDEAKVMIKCTPEDRVIIHQNMKKIEQMYRHCVSQKSFKGKHKEIQFALNHDFCFVNNQ